MHAYLLIGTNKSEVETEITKLAKKLKARVMEFPLAKIDDARTLNSFLKLKLINPTAIIINSIEDATIEAGNAFLKNLEEPQENLYFILTTESVHKVLPTLVSRCQIVKVQNTKQEVLSTDVENFPKMSVGEKLAFTDQVRDRGDAKTFVRDLISLLHQNLHKESMDYSKIVHNLEAAQKTLDALNANGNVTLQLTNLVIQLQE